MESNRTDRFAPLVAYDRAAGGPTWTVDADDFVDLHDWQTSGIQRGDAGDQVDVVEVGTLVGRNDFQFARRAGPPDLRACLYTPEKRTLAVAVPDRSFPRSWEPDPDSVRIAAHDHERLDLAVVLERGGDVALTEETRNELGTIPVSTAETCPSSVAAPRLVIATG